MLKKFCGHGILVTANCDYPEKLNNTRFGVPGYDWELSDTKGACHTLMFIFIRWILSRWLIHAHRYDSCHTWGSGSCRHSSCTVRSYNIIILLSFPQLSTPSIFVYTNLAQQ